MLQALLAGVASIKAQQTRMNVIGNNLANVNTTAFRGGRVTFQDMLAQTIRGASRPSADRGGTNPVQFGLGVLVAGTDVNTEQGSLNATNRPSDLAVQGNGFFIVSNGSRVAYTRDGGFDLDASGQLVHRATGERVVGWSADSFGVIDSNTPIDPTSKLTIPLGALNAVQVTTRVNFAGNLNGQAGAAETWSTSVRVYDTLGGSHDITVTFSNRADPPEGTPPTGAVSSWRWTATEGSTTIGSFSSGSNQRLYFDSNGRLINADVLGRVTVPASAGGAPAFNVDLSFANIGQLKTESQVNASDQNGFPPGSLQGYTVGNDGIITGQG
jgi:flagellar hook protein FlgE